MPTVNCVSICEEKEANNAYCDTYIWSKTFQIYSEGYTEKKQTGISVNFYKYT